MSNHKEKTITSKPILFNSEMVRAILAGRKTVTRRAVKLIYDNTHHEVKTDKYGTRLIELQNDVEGETFGKNPDGSTWHKLLAYREPQPPYRKGDILYVRETWQYMYNLDGNDQIIEGTGRYIYAADDQNVDTWVNPDGTHRQGIPWKPSIHMPKEAARIWLKVTKVGYEQLHNITMEEIRREGLGSMAVHAGDFHIATKEFQQLWDSTVKMHDHIWEKDPYVWVVHFERCDKPD